YNIISGNTSEGVLITDSGTAGNSIINNYIGTNGDGSAARANGDAGVVIQNGASDNTVGGGGTSAYNVISGNKSDGVRIFGAGTTGNVLLGNYIGTNGSGSGPLANKGEGVYIDAAPDNTVGGTTA